MFAKNRVYASSYSIKYKFQKDNLWVLTKHQVLNEYSHTHIHNFRNFTWNRTQLIYLKLQTWILLMACGGKGVLSGRDGFSCFISTSNESNSVATGILGCLMVLLMALELSFRNWCSEFGGRVIAVDEDSSFADNFCPFPSAVLVVFTHPLSKGSCLSSFIDASSTVELTLLPTDCESNFNPVPAFAVSEDSTSVSLSSTNH